MNFVMKMNNINRLKKIKNFILLILDMQNKTNIMDFFKKHLNVLMFATLSISWGFSWFCGKYQINTDYNPIGILPEISGFYRFLLAAFFLIVIYIPIKKPRIIPTIFELKTIIIYSVFSFCLNFIIFYYAIYNNI